MNFAFILSELVANYFFQRGFESVPAQILSNINQK